MARKKKNTRDVWASLDDKDKAFTRIYPGLIMSYAYQSLSIGARQFYILCRVQACSKEGRQVLFNHGKESGIQYDCERDFVFPASHLERFGVKRQNSTRYFKELEKAGFIDRLENNKHRKKVNVYSFSSRWKSFCCASER